MTSKQLTQASQRPAAARLYSLPAAQFAKPLIIIVFPSLHSSAPAPLQHKHRTVKCFCASSVEAVVDNRCVTKRALLLIPGRTLLVDSSRHNLSSQPCIRYFNASAFSHSR